VVEDKPRRWWERRWWESAWWLRTKCERLVLVEEMLGAMVEAEPKSTWASGCWSQQILSEQSLGAPRRGQEYLRLREDIAGRGDREEEDRDLFLNSNRQV
jgi:hypothetical protein